MHSSTCLLQGFWGQFRGPRIGTPTKALTTHQAHKCVLPSLPRAHALKKNQDLPNQYHGAKCRQLDKGSSSEHLLQAPPVHVWTVTQVALVRECEVYCTTANNTSAMTLTLQPFLKAGEFDSFQVFQCCYSGNGFCYNRIFRIRIVCSVQIASPRFCASRVFLTVSLLRFHMTQT